AKTYDADSKKKVVPELMPRALYWFRWGALYTWVTGILLFFLVYPVGGIIPKTDGGMHPHAVGTIMIAVWIVAFFLYDVLWKSGVAKNETVGALISYVVVIGVAFAFASIAPGRAVYIGIGSLFGTIMMMNVWMRIWPSQRKIIAGIAGKGPAPDASVPALA